MDLRLYKRCGGNLDTNESDHGDSTITLDEEEKLEEIITYSGLNLNKKEPKSTKLKQNTCRAYSNSSFTIDRECNSFKKRNKQVIEFVNDDYLIGGEIAPADCKKPDSSESFKLASSKYVLQKPVEQKRTFLKTKTQARSTFIDNDEEDSYKIPRKDKTSYCRPVKKHCSQELVSKAIERNFKLQLLLKKLLIAREKEKHNDIWNKYISELKKKHGYYDYQPCETPKHETNLGSGTTANVTDGNIYSHQHNAPTACRAVSSYASNIYCYPTSAEGRLMLVNQGVAAKRTSWQCQHGNKKLIVVGKDTNRKQHNKIWESHECSTGCTEQQLDFEHNKCPMCYGDKKVEMKPNAQQTERIKCECTANSETEVQLKTKQDAIMSLDNLTNAKKNTFTKIENKLDSLIKSFNAFVAESRAKKSLTTESTNTDAPCGCEYRKNKSEKRSWLHSKHDFTCAVTQESESVILFPRNSSMWKDAIDSFSYDEDSKSEKIKRDIDEILTKNSVEWSNPVKFSDEIPTKDYTTKATDSPHTTHLKNHQEIDKEVRVEEIFTSDDNKCMTIAVNTDPLGLSALIRVSADTVRQILSHMPSLDCSCLSRLPVYATAPHSDVIARYMCNICGASFLRAAQLSEHIQKHNLANSRHCCVCKQLVELDTYCGKLFACQHCGQVFTRAYCRELHEQTCARTVGKKHDVTPSRMLLR